MVEEGLSMVVCIHTCMTSKNVIIKEEDYRKLKDAKREGESFGDVIERLLSRRTSLLPLWGSLSSSEAISEIEEQTREIRKKATIRA